MRIAVDTRKISDDHPGDYGSFLYQILKRLTEKNRDHEFIFIFDRPYSSIFLFNKNVIPISIGPKTSNFLLCKIWYDVKIPALLRKYKADVFIGNGMCSLKSKIPQAIIIDDLSFLNFPSFAKTADRFFLKKYFKKYLQKANSIITASEYLKTGLLSRYPVDKQKITVVTGAASDVFYRLEESSKEGVKQHYTDGKSFFIYAGTIEPRKNLVNLLRAFSIFKRRQKSDWKLVLSGRIKPGYNRFVQNMQTYKYRDDVIMTGYLKPVRVAELTASAYAFICPSLGEDSGMQIAGAMKANTPLIISDNPGMRETAGNAALYIDPLEHHDIADKMMLLYKDESLRNRLIEKGKIAAAAYDWQKATDLFWETVLKAIK
jgi:glycosyltransferase involved in cell wall biosynthesis